MKIKKKNSRGTFELKCSQIEGHDSSGYWLQLRSEKQREEINKKRSGCIDWGQTFGPDGIDKLSDLTKISNN